MNKNSTIPRDNIQVVNLVRSLAMFSVLAYHLSGVLLQPKKSEKLVWDWITSNGSGGVFMFLVVSGFLITRIIDLGSDGDLFKPNWKNFYIRRFARIIPLFSLHVFGGFVLMFGLIYFFNQHASVFSFLFKLPPDPFDKYFWISIFTFSFNWVEAFKYEEWQRVGVYWGILWTLAVEEQFYIFYPFYLKILGNVKRLTLVLLLLVFICFFWKFNFLTSWPNSVRDAVQMNIICFGEIGMGVLLYLACKSFYAVWFKRKGLCLFLSMTGAIFIFSSYGSYFFAGRSMGDKAFVLGAGVFLFLLGSIHLDIFESETLKIFTLLGKYSYAAYLLHVGILFFVQPFLIDKDVFFALGYFSVITTAVAFVSYRIFEFPMNNIIRGWFKLDLKRKET